MAKLRSTSGFFLEVAAWAPLVSYLFDTICTYVSLLGSPDTPDDVRAAFAGVTEAFVGILHGAIRRVHYHSLRTNHGVKFAEAFQTQLTLEGQHASFLPSDVLEFDRKLVEKVVSVHQMAAASRGTESAGSRGRSKYCGRGGRGPSRSRGGRSKGYLGGPSGAPSASAE